MHDAGARGEWSWSGGRGWARVGWCKVGMRQCGRPRARPRGSVSAGAGAGAAGWALGACGHLSCERERASATTTTTATKNNKTPLWRARALVKYLNVLLRERAIMSTQTGAQSATPRTHTARAIRQLVQTSRCAASQTCSMPDAHSAMRRRARSALSRRRLRTRFRQTS